MSYGDIMKKSDIYLNCPTSKDKEQDLEVVVNNAIEKKVDVLSIINCIQKADGILRTTYSCSSTLKRSTEIADLQKMRKEITLLNGIQIPEPYARGNELGLYARFPIDVITGVVYDFKRELEKEEDIKKAYDDYYLKNLYAVQSGNIDTLSHLGFIHAFYGYKYHNDPLINALLEEMIHRNVLLEITPSISQKGNFSIFPSSDLLKRYRELGGEMVTIGTYANDIQDIGKNLEDGYEIAQDLGLEPGYFQKRKFKKII